MPTSFWRDLPDNSYSNLPSHQEVCEVPANQTLHIHAPSSIPYAVP